MREHLMQMSYWRFAAMIVTSTVVMFGLMYVHTHTWDDVYFSETRAWMAVLMGATMAIVMLGFMLGMYRNRTLNAAILIGASLVLVLAIWLIRSQVTVTGSDYMSAMIPHHSIAILTSTRAGIDDPRVRKLADEIVDAQLKEIAELKYLLRVVNRGPRIATSAAPMPESMSAGEAARTANLQTTDLEPLSDTDVQRILGASAACRFSYAAGTGPVAVAMTTGESAGGLIKLHGRLVRMTAHFAAAPALGFQLSGDDVTVEIRLREESVGDDPGDADAILRVGGDLESGYAGVYTCSG